MASQVPRAQGDIFGLLFFVYPAVQNSQVFNLQWCKTDHFSKSSLLRDWIEKLFSVLTIFWLIN